MPDAERAAHRTARIVDCRVAGRRSPVRRAAGRRKTIATPLALAVAASLLVASCASPGSVQQRSCFHSSESVEKDIGFCQAVRVGTTLHVSGVVGQGDMAAAMRSVYTRLDQILAANGASYADVVKETVFAVDLDAFIRNKDLRKEFYGANLPAATWVQVQRLYLPSFVVEVEVTAELRK